MRKLVILTCADCAKMAVDTGALDGLEGSETYWAVGDESPDAEAALAGRENRLGPIGPPPDGGGDRYGNVRSLILYSRRGRSRELRSDPTVRRPLSLEFERARRRPVEGLRIDARLRVRIERREPWQLATLPPVRALLTRLLLHRAGLHRQVTAMLTEVRPDVVVVPSCGPSDLLIDVVRAARRLGVPSLVPIFRWNGSRANTPLTLRPSEENAAIAPDHLAVWGEHSAEHFARIHGFSRDRLTILGAPGLDRFADDRDEGSFERPFPFRYLLFMGSEAPFDEASTLRHLDRLIDEEGLDLKVVYRAHPRRMDGTGAEAVDGTLLEHVVVEPSPDHNGASDPGRDRYRALIEHAEFAVAPPSVALFEVAACDRRQIILDYEDPGTRRRVRGVAHSYLQGLDKLEGLVLCHEPADLERALRSFVRDGAPPTASPRDQIGYWVHRNDRPYAERLAELAERVGAGGRVPAG